MTTPQKPTRGSKKRACVECRQQKMRCVDGSEDQATPCSRCQRLNISCVYSIPFQRVHKRKRIQELEQETSDLRRELQNASPSISCKAQVQNTRTIEPTETQSIDGLELGPAIIDSCFKLYFHGYHPLLPILDPTTTPNLLYGKSLVLFWVVISIGSRKYSAYPSLINALSSRVSSLVLSSLNSRTQPIESIKAVLLLLEWPFPATPYRCDPSFVLSGALIHMAMQSWLHTPYHRMTKPKMDVKSSYFESTKMERAQLWAYVIILYQRTCTKDGQPALWAIDTYTEQEQFKDISRQFPTELQLQLQLANIMARAQRTFIQFGSQNLSSQQERTLDSVLKMINSQLDTLESGASSDWERFHVATCRLEVAAMHFFKSPESFNIQDCQFIFDTTINFFQFIQDQENSHQLSNFCPRFILFAVKLGQCLMLRILKGPFAGYFDQEQGSKIFHAIINFMKSVSIEHGDTPHKTAEILEQMWTSNKIFKNEDGSFKFALRIKNRLSLSLISDIGARWREEFLNSNKQADSQQTFGSLSPLKPANHSHPTVNSVEQDDFASILGTEGLMMSMNGLSEDFGFDLDDLWSRNFDSH